MNKVNYNQTGGFPLDTTNLQFLQDALQLMQSFGEIAGDRVILTGCEKTGTTIAPGVVFINGEILPFEGGTEGANVIIVETAENGIFESVPPKPIEITRVARFGTSGNSFPWSGFARFKTNKELSGQTVPIGAIMLWAGAVNAVPVGWALCDGANGTPDLKGKFIVGYDPADADYNTISKTGGEKRVTLTVDQLPKHTPTGSTDSADGHTHGYQDDYFIESNISKAPILGSKRSLGSSYVGSNGGVDTDNNTMLFQSKTTDNAGSHSHTIMMNEIGGGQPHENRPPYYVLAYIQFKGV